MTRWSGLGLAAGILLSGSTTQSALALPEPQAGHRASGRITPDHALLRDLADHHEGMVLLAHRAMEQRHQHAGGTDRAGEADVLRDASKTEILQLLRSLYRDTREPKPTAADKAAVDSIMGLMGEPYEKALRDFTMRHHRATVKLIDRAMSQLRVPKVKSLARRLRSEYSKEIERFERETK